MLTCSWGGTGLARLVPGLAHEVGAAAHLLGHVERQLVLARVVEVAVAHTLPHVCHGNTTKGHNQGLSETCMKHSAKSKTDCPLMDLTHAVVASVDLHVLRWADTGVVSKSVVAGTRPADADVGCAFINV